MQQGRVLDDQRVRLGDRFAGPDRRVAEAAEGDDGGAGALRAEARERLGVAALVEGGDREQLGGGDHSLAAAAMDAHLERRPQPFHRVNVEPRAPCFIRGSRQSGRGELRSRDAAEVQAPTSTISIRSPRPRRSPGFSV